MLDQKYCYLLSQVKTKPYVEPQPIVQKPCTKPEDDKPVSMADVLDSFTLECYLTHKSN
jgi:hypothetical protein